AILEGLGGVSTVLICGMLNTKDPEGYFRALASVVSEVLTVPITSSDSGVAPENLAAIAQSAGLKASAATDITTALAAASAISVDRVLIGGSLYLVGDALAQNGTPPV
ncbi:MAG: bifunctional folylpolyglutamate synthase/dihydrofolate synthase, partial [Pseudomonadota bacterium]